MEVSKKLSLHFFFNFILFISEYYRASIIRESSLNSREYLIEYVDFGTKSYANVNDLFEEVIAGDLPIQGSRYFLANIVPVNSDKFSVDDLTYLHQLIVEQDDRTHVKIVYALDNMKCVKISLTRKNNQEIKDVAQHLIDEGKAKYCSENLVSLKSFLTFESKEMCDEKALYYNTKTSSNSEDSSSSMICVDPSTR